MPLTQNSRPISMDLRQIAVLLVVFILYIIFGAIIFKYLESSHETAKREELEELLIEFRDKIIKLNDPNITEQNITALIIKLIDAQYLNLFDSNHSNQTNNWHFFNSFFFAITVTTTIGYGHLSPSTVFGRIFCIIYAMFGIPVTGILLRCIGDHLSQCFLKKISKLINRFNLQLPVRLEMLFYGFLFLVPWFTLFLIGPAYIFSRIEHWTFLDAIYYCFVTLSTIGFGDYVAARFQSDFVWFYKMFVILWIVFGLAYLSMIRHFIRQCLTNAVKSIENIINSIRFLKKFHNRAINSNDFNESIRMNNTETINSDSEQTSVTSANNGTELLQQQINENDLTQNTVISVQIENSSANQPKKI